MYGLPDVQADKQRVVGAEPVNDELEVGFNSRFERVWHRYEIAGRVIMTVVVAAGLAGLLGSGPFSHRTLNFPTGRLAAIDFEPITRFDTPSQVTFHLRTAAVPSLDTPVQLRLSSNVVEPFGLQHSLPVATSERSSHGDLVLTVPVADSNDDLIRIVGKPTQVGLIRMFAQVDDGPRLSWVQFVLP
jgi:hypothetical protein